MLRTATDVAFTQYEVKMFEALTKFCLSLLSGERDGHFWDLSAFEHCPNCGWGSPTLGAGVDNPALDRSLESEAAILCKKAAAAKEAADKTVSKCELLPGCYLLSRCVCRYVTSLRQQMLSGCT